MKTVLITGAFGYIGSYAALSFLEQGYRVRTLTNSPNRESPLQGKVEVFPLSEIKSSLFLKAFEGVDVFVNTLGIRFPFKNFSFDHAFDLQKHLFSSAKEAGIQRYVYLSVLHGDKEIALPYYRYKRKVEDFLNELNLDGTILAPSLVFGIESTLISNLAWMMKRFPFIFLMGKDWKICPIFVEDLAALIIDESRESGFRRRNALGPEELSMKDLFLLMKEALDSKCMIIPAPAWFIYLASLPLSLILRDSLITRDEVEALHSGLLTCSEKKSALFGTRSLKDFLKLSVGELGKKYLNERERRRNRRKSYKKC